MGRLAGKVAFITGGGGGIGRATAERFAEEGAKVVIAEIDVGRGEAAAQSARSRASNSGGDAHFVHCDIRERANVEAAFAETVRRFGGLHILHNNAGGSSPDDGRVTDVSEDEFWRVIKLDVYGTFLCSRLGIPHMIKSGGGSIINMSSVASSVTGVPNRFAYGASKAAVIGITRSVAKDFVGKVRCNAICPGTVESPSLRDRVRAQAEANGQAEADVRAQFEARQPMGRLGRPEEIAMLAVYLASDESAFTTGTVSLIDGGWTT
jgi:2-keto-3-deoxy-L-fuconate dehydrogenase